MRFLGVFVRLLGRPRLLFLAGTALAAHLSALSGSSALQAAELPAWVDEAFPRPGPQEEGTWYIEYGRGMSTGVTADIDLKFRNSEFTVHDVELEPEDYAWGTSQTRFFGLVFGNEPGTWDGALTEPYYVIRFHYFPKNIPYLGFGLEQTHFKTFLKDFDQKNRVKGIRGGASINERREISDIFAMYSISHGVNHLSFNLTYRRMFFADEEAPDGRLQPYFSLNLGPAIPHHEVLYRENGRTIGKAYEFQPSIQNWGFGFSLGTRYRMFKHFGLYLEYKFTHSILHGLRFDSKVDGSTGEVDTQFSAHHFHFGISLIL